jgi:hypothetical protein
MNANALSLNAVNTTVSLTGATGIVLNATNGTTTLNGSTASGGNNILTLTNNAALNGRSNIVLVGRYQGSVDAWNIATPSNAIIFNYQTTNGGTVSPHAAIQAHPGEGVGVLLSAYSNTLPVLKVHNTGAIQVSGQPYCFLYGAVGYGTSYYNYTTQGHIFGKNYNDGPYLAVATSVGMTNTGTNGWIASSGFFYAPATGKYQINISFYWNAYGAGVRWSLNHYNSAGVLQRSRYCMVDGNGWNSDTLRSYSTILQMTAGDYFAIIYTAGGGTTTAYFNGEDHSSMSIAMIN